MKPDPKDTVRYSRSRFITRLPKGYIYTRAHFWLVEDEPGLWRVGLTQFASRMLGDLVELEFRVEPGAELSVGEVIGALEGFKAITELYSVMDGRFEGGNPLLDEDVTRLDSEPYGDGWLYRVRGQPDTNALDVNTYIAVLDATIDKMLEDQRKPPDL